MNDMENLRTFADQLWKYMVPKLDSKFASNVSYFRAQVVSNPGNNKLEVQRPVENGTLTLPCVRAMSNAQPGQQVVALVMGSMSNAIVVGDGNLNVPGGGGDVGIANFQAQLDGSLVITLINGNTLTATPVMDDVPTQGSNLAVKSGGIYTALNGKADNAFANVQVGSTTIAADNNADTLTLVGDGLATLTGNATNDSVTIYVDPNHTHITTQVLDLVNADSYGPSGMVSFDADVSEVPLKSCLVEIKPAQEGSGDPSPSNIRPISGWTGAKATRSGKNLAQLTANSTQLNGLTFTVDKAAGTVTVNGTSTAKTYFSVFARANAYPYLDDISYVLSGCPSGGSSATYYAYNGVLSDGFVDYGSGSPTKMGNQLTKGNGQNYYIYVNTGVNCNNLVFRPMIRVAGTDATFEPYKGQTIEYTFPTEAGTVYGGTLDVLKGTLTVDRASVTITGGLRYYQEHTNHYRFIFNALDGKAEPNSTSKLLSDIGVPISAQGFSSASVGVYIGNGNAMGSLYLNKSLVSPNNESANAWVASHPVQIVYPLETPITYQLTPELVATLAGQNNFWADCGDVTVEYGAFLAAEAEARKIVSKILNANKAASDHTHSAWDITQGILPIDRGGTGNSTGFVQAGLRGDGSPGINATAEGYMTRPGGNYSHAEGYDTYAFGECSHAEGTRNTTAGKNSHAEGENNSASGECQHVFGKFNKANTTDVEIVGWGTSSARKNIRTLDRSGNMTIAGTLTQASDARLKDVQGEIPDLSSIRAVRFRWKNGDDKEHLGYLAQDVEGVAPYLVGVDSNGYKSLDYIALLTAKVEMLEREIEKLKGR